MNKSNYINPENCRNCGLCCQSFSIVYDKKLAEIDPIMFSEIIRFKDLDSDGQIEVKEFETCFEVEFKFPCKWLGEDYIKGKRYYSCKAYNSDRPLLCQEFPYEETTKEDCPFKEKQ